jgi:putative addiction module component (TIGR02574 family)
MLKTTLAIESQALALPLGERAELVSRLLDSLEVRETANAKEVEGAWIEEANRRYQALVAGSDGGLTHNQVFDDLRVDRH